MYAVQQLRAQQPPKPEFVPTPSNFTYDTGFDTTPSELEDRCFFRPGSFDVLFRPIPQGNHTGVHGRRSRDQLSLLTLIAILIYDTNKLLNHRLRGGGSLKKNKKNKKSQKKK